jgi:hypothetical protein
MNVSDPPSTASPWSETIASNRIFSARVILGVVIVSAIYFTDVSIRSSKKLFWYDELYTWYLCQLPSFKSTWAAVQHGADFNPPLFYLLTRISQSLFGHGLIATRLPETVGVWLFGLCLFIFVSRRAGVIAGAVAGLFPFFTLAQYYAYEARPHGLTLGWCGLALLCWQRVEETKHKYLWIGGFCLSLLAAVLTHVYAIFIIAPFAAVEVYSTWRNRKVNWAMWAAMLLAVGVAVFVYLPLIRTLRPYMRQAGGLPAVPWDLLRIHLKNVFGPALAILFVVIASLALERFRAKWVRKGSTIPDSELLLAIVFACLPIMGIAGLMIAKGPFYDRYFLSSIAGWAILIGFAVSPLRSHSSEPRVIAAGMFVLLLGNLANATGHLKSLSSLPLIEPSTGIVFSSDPRQPMLLHNTLVDAKDEDILVLQQLDYLFLYRYAPKEIVSRLYDGALENDDFHLVGYQILANQAHLDLKVSTLSAFMESRSKFLVYVGNRGALPVCGDCIEIIQGAGFVLKSETGDAGGILYDYDRPPARPGR